MGGGENQTKGGKKGGEVRDSKAQVTQKRRRRGGEKRVQTMGRGGRGGGAGEGK